MGTGEKSVSGDAKTSQGKMEEGRGRNEIPSCCSSEADRRSRSGERMTDGLSVNEGETGDDFGVKSKTA